MEQKGTVPARTSAQDPEARSPFIPLMLIALTLLLLIAFQTAQFVRERATLAQLKSNQEIPIEEARKLRAQLDSLGRNTAQLAAQGNENAKAIVEQLRKEGITINPNATP